MEQAPSAKPWLTFGEVKKTISPYWFNRSLLRSFSFLAFDLVMVALLMYYMTYYFTLPGILGGVLWLGYCAAQGKRANWCMSYSA